MELSDLNLIAMAINKESGIQDNDSSFAEHILGKKHKGYYWNEKMKRNILAKKSKVELKGIFIQYVRNKEN